MLDLWLGVFGVYTLFLGINSLRSTYKTSANLFFSLMVLSASVWFLSMAFLFQTTSLDFAKTCIQIAYSSIALIFLNLFFLAINLVYKKIKVWQYLLILLPSSSNIILLLFDASWIVTKIEVGPATTWITSTNEYSIYSMIMLGYFLASIFVLIAGSLNRNNNYLLRRQLLLVSLAYLLSALIGGVLDFAYSGLKNHSLIFYGPVSFAVFISIFYYAMAKYRLFDIRTSIVKSGAYVASLMLIVAMYTFSELTISKYISKDGNSIFIDILLVIIFAHLFYPIQKFFVHYSEQIFFKNKYKINDFTSKVGQIILTTTELKSILANISNIIIQNLNSKYVVAVTINPKNNEIYTHKTENSPKISLPTLKKISKVFENKKQTVWLRNTIDTHLEDYEFSINLSQRFDAVFLVPLISVNKMIGFLILGDKKSSGYTDKDIRALNIIKNEIAIGLQNSMSLDEVKKVNQSLEEKILQATKKLQESNTKLRKLDETKDEFISMASHQLRTPLTSIKGYISMVLDGDAGRVNKNQKILLSQAFVSSERMARLISDFLNVSRLQTGKFALHKTKTSLNELILEEVQSIQSLADAHGIKLHYNPPTRQHLLNIDVEKFRQVLMNFIDNAIFYSKKEGNVTIKLYVKGKKQVCLIIDDGIGVPDSAQAKLFNKFYRADNARKSRPDGTGVGLYLAQKVVTAHKGRLIFKSKEGKGSTFGFELPMEKDI